MLGLAPLLTGCILSADPADRTIEVAPRYLAAAPDRYAAPPAPDWWRDFRSHELTDLVERARACNLDVAAAVARIKQADATARVTGAPLLPEIDANGSAQRSRSSAATGSGDTSSISSRNRTLYTAVLNASYEIDFWGKNRAALLAAQETADASRYDRDVVELSTVGSVITTYFAVVAAQDRLRIAQENLRNARRVLAVIRQRVDVGTASDLDLAQQESVVAQQRAAIPPLDQTRRQNIASLAVLVGEVPERFAVRGGSLGRIAPPRVRPGMPSELLLQRPDIRESEAQLAAGDANVVNARAALFPSITLTGQAGYESAVLKSLFTPQAALYSVAANLAQPIFDGGRLLNTLDLQKARQEELLQTYRKTVYTAFADVERALIAVRDLAAQERLQGEATRTARRAYQLSEEQLRAGTVDLTTVLNTQRTYFQAQDALVQVRLARLQAIVSLFQALGGGWGAPEI